MWPDFLSSKNLFSKTFISRFVDQFAKGDNWHEMDVAKSNLGYGLIHYALIRVQKPKHILCVGSRYGFVPAICALACKHNNYGKVDFVDAGYDWQVDTDKQHWGGVGFWKKVNLKQHFGTFGLNEYIQTHVMTTEMFRKKIKARKWEYMYIDGDHSYKGSLKDYTMFWPSLAKKGFMVFHDIFDSQIGDVEFGVPKVWKKLFTKKHTGIELKGLCGLGILQKT